MKKLLSKIFCCIGLAMLVIGIQANISHAEQGQSDVAISIDGNVSTKYTHFTYWGNPNYTASTPALTAFWDANGKYNVAYTYSNKVIVQRYNAGWEMEKKIEIPYELTLFGNITSDGTYYYIVWGQYASMNENVIVNCTAKYDMDGNKIGCCDMTARETSSGGIGATDNGSCSNEPFNFAGCELDLKGGILACNYGRVMFNGHQSNFVFYVDTESMTRVNADKSTPYCSHSFFQDILRTSDGKYLTLNMGDAYSRGIEVAKVNADGTELGEFVTFHFRENPEFYQNILAQLGGAIETYSGYVVCGTSENTLSFDTPANKNVNESRNLFIQVIKKDFYSIADKKDRYVIEGEQRTATGTPLNGKNGCYLADENGNSGNNISDYGVIWLTNYSDGTYFACNPKILNVDNYFAVMWERRKYNDENNTETYYMILDSNYNTVKGATLLDKVFLPINVTPQYRNGCIYWTTSGDGFGTRINVLDVYEAIGQNKRLERTASIEGYTLSLSGKIGVNCYMDISDGLINDVNSKVIIYNGVSKEEISIYNLKDKTDDGYYVFSLEKAAKEMRESVRFEVYSGDELIVEDNVSVYEYAQVILDNKENSSAYEKAQPLVRAMLNYGGYAQQFFGYNTEQLANEGVFTADTDPVKVGYPIFPTKCATRINNAMKHDSDFMSFYGATLVCESDTTLKWYFKLKDPDNALSVWNKKYYCDSKFSREIQDEYFVFKIENISPKDFDKEYSFNYYCWDTTTWSYFSYSPVDYLYLGSQSDNEKLSNICRAMYYYWIAARSYK